MWVAEDVPVHWVFKDEEPPPGGGRVPHTVIRHRSRVSAGKAMGHYLIALSGRPAARERGEYGLLHGAADMFKASGSTREHTGLMVRIGNRVFRIIEEEENET
jgi:hypothetical protein